jgi:HlyD family secretion protein
MKKLIIVVVLLVTVGVAAGAYYMRRGGPEPQVTTQQVTRGDVVKVVGATGTLGAVTTVDVGTQVSGIVQELYADFNSIVRKGQVIARLDPSLIQTRIEQQRANVVRAEADLDRLKVTLADTQQKLVRARELFNRSLVPRTELEAAELAVKSADSQIKSSDAGLVQARANLRSEEVNLRHTIIESPIDGIVISRNVDPGQTVASSMSAPTLFVIAADLTKMQVIASIDEADVGTMRPDQPVTFRVDAYPTDTFTGTVEQVRLQPAVVQNVVTYSTVIAVPNPDLRLKPGMTANVTIEIARRNNVLRIPNAALNFRPTEEIFAALKLPVPPDIQTAGGRGGRGRGDGRPGGGQPGGQAGGGQPAGAQPGGAQTGPAGASAPPVQGTGGASQPAQPAQPNALRGERQREGSADARGGGDGASREGGERVARGGQSGEGGAAREGRGGGRGGFDPNMTPEERRKRLEERMASMSPEEREQFTARMARGRGGEGGGRGGPGFAGREGQAGGGRGQTAAGGASASGGQNRQATQGVGANRGITQRANESASAAMRGGATTIDALFGPLATVETRGRVWVWKEQPAKELRPVQLRLGVSDGAFSEVISGEVNAGDQVVTRIVIGLGTTTTTPQPGANNPLMGPQRGRGGPGRGRG